MNILEALKDPQLFRPFLADKNDSLDSWRNWFACLRVLYGLKLPKSRHDVIEEITGRDPAKLPKRGFDTALFLTGRRSGKSRTAAIIGAYEAVLAGHEAKLAKGEHGVVVICSPTKSQSRIVRDYLRSIFDAPLLQAEVVNETQTGFELANGNRIEILAGDWRTIRGFTLIAAIVDEAAFFGYDSDSKVKNDSELIRALKPALATVNGKLICITSPYAKRGFCFKTYQKNFGNDAGKVLVVNCPSRTLNTTLPQSVVDDALAEDMAAAKAEYLGEFRDDVGEFLARGVIEALVVDGRLEIPFRSGRTYVAFVDVSGGRKDDAALAVAHREGRTVVVDLLRRYKPPFNPYHVVGLMAEELKRYSLPRVTGDNYSAEFVAQAFQAVGIYYQQSDKAKNVLYGELLPRLCASEIELLDDETLVNQLAGLERRTRAGGKDIIDHPPGGHDDVANAVAGVAALACAHRITIGAFK